MQSTRLLSILTLLVLALTFGCQKGSSSSSGDTSKPNGDVTEDEIRAERAKLSPEERKLVDEQDYCPIMTKARLGAMGKPLKVKLGDEEVYVCCKACAKKAEKKPAETVAAVKELRAKNAKKD